MLLTLCHFVDTEILSVALVVTFFAKENKYVAWQICKYVYKYEKNYIFLQVLCLKLSFLNIKLIIKKDNSKQPSKGKLSSLDNQLYTTTLKNRYFWYLVESNCTTC